MEAIESHPDLYNVAIIIIITIVYYYYYDLYNVAYQKQQCRRQ